MAETPSRQAIIPEGAQRMYQRLRFSPGLKAGGLLFVSGQVGRLPDNTIAQGVEAQIDAALANLGAVLREAGVTYAEVADITSFHVGDMSEHFRPFIAAIGRTFPEPYPAWTAVQVAGLAMPELLVEVKATALA